MITVLSAQFSIRMPILGSVFGLVIEQRETFLVGTIITRPGCKREWHPNIQGIGPPEVALVCSKNAWKSITGHITEAINIQEAQERDKQIKHYLKENSYEMRKNWKNSVENLRKERLRQLEGKKEVERKQQEEYLTRLLEQKNEERKKYVDRMKKQLFYQQDDTKNLTSGLMLTETIYERDKQREFNQKIANLDKDDNDEYIRKIAEDAQKFHEEEKAERQKQLKKDLELQADILKQMEENAQQRDRTKQIEEEKKILDLMAERFKEIENQEKEEKLKKKKMSKCLLEDSIRQRKEYEKRMQTEDEEDDRINQAFLATKARISDVLRRNLNKRKKEKLKIIEDIGNEVFSHFKSTEERDQEIMEKVIAENNAKLDADKAAREAHIQKLAEEKRQAFADYLVENEERLDQEHQLKLWEKMNHMKNAQVFNEFIANEKKKHLARQEKYKVDILKQSEEDTKRRFDAEEKDVADFRKELERFKENDIRFIAYANKIIKDRKENGRNTLPLERVLNEFKIRRGFMESDRQKRNRKIERPGQKLSQQGRRYTKPSEDPTIEEITKDVSPFDEGTLRAVKRNER